MTTYTWPLTDGFVPAHWEFGADPATLATRSILTGGIQTSRVPGKRWLAGMVLTGDNLRGNRAEIEGFLDRLNGQEHSVSLWHFTRAGVGGFGYPMGTINQTGVTVKTTAAQFATSIVLTGCGAAKTLAAGDLYSVGGQLLMVPVQLTANGSGEITVPVTGGLRAAALATAPVTLVRPTAKFVLASPQWRSGYAPGMAETLALDWEEDLR